MMRLMSLLVFSVAFAIVGCSFAAGSYDVEDHGRGTETGQHTVPFSSWQFPSVSPFDQLSAEVHSAIFSSVHPTPFKGKCYLAAVSTEALKLLDINSTTVMNNKEFLAFVAGNVVKQGSSPKAHTYGGHSFGEWDGKRGDGRSHMLGAYKNREGEIWILQLKGSGKTPFSEKATNWNKDGRTVLRESLREFLVSEAMHYYHVPSTRAASLVICDDLVERVQFNDGHSRKERTAVILRLAQSFFRIGSLEKLAKSGKVDQLRKLVNFMIRKYVPDLSELSEQDRYLSFFHTVVYKTAELIAWWMSLGFTHGSFNTDNCGLLGMTIDFGTFGFMEEYNEDYVSNACDPKGVYSFISQTAVGLFNLDKLRRAMYPLFLDKERSKSDWNTTYISVFYQTYMDIMRQKLGLSGLPSDCVDEMLITDLLMIMNTPGHRGDFTMTFRELSEISLADLLGNKFRKEFWALRIVSAHPDWQRWVQAYVRRLQNNGISENERQRRMQAVNPCYILRNYILQRAIEKAEKLDFSEIKLLQKTLERPFERQDAAEEKGYASKPPDWGIKQQVSCS